MVTETVAGKASAWKCPACAEPFDLLNYKSSRLLLSAKHHRNRIYFQSVMRFLMLFQTRWFGVTASGAERATVREKAEIEEIIEKSLLLQAKSAAQQHRPIGRGTHVKGVCADAQFEVWMLEPGASMAIGKLTSGLLVIRRLSG